MADWQTRAFCTGANPDIFSEPGYEDTAKAYCQRCPVSVDCLAYAMSANEEGIWGGTTFDERKALKRGGERRTCPGCRASKIFSDGVFEICLSCGLSWPG